MLLLGLEIKMPQIKIAPIKLAMLIKPARRFKPIATVIIAPRFMMVAVQLKIKTTPLLNSV